MPAITVRNLPDSVHLALKQRASAEKLSVESLVRSILANEVTIPARRDTPTSGFSEVPLAWGHQPPAVSAKPAGPLPDLWGALQGTVRIEAGADIAAPLDEGWEAAG